MQKIEKVIISFLIILIIVVNLIIFGVLKVNIDLDNNLEQKMIKASKKGKLIYEVYQNDKLIEIFSEKEEALEYAKKYENSSVKKSGDYKWLWDSNPPYEVYQNYNLLVKFSDYKEALEYAKKYENSSIFYRKSSTFIWDSSSPLNKSSYFIENVPSLRQYPELSRGCEVTSLAMLLNYKGINVSKMELAEKIKKEPFYFNLENGDAYNGNPNIGFVGDMYSFENSGYGVYNEPIYSLFQTYVKEEALNLTGASFEDLYYYINKNIPIWVITNTRFEHLPESEFEYLKTTRGDLKITYREHSVVITGYDENYIYFNDPMYLNKTGKQPKKDFIKAWEQMGKQAITYCP